MAVDLRHKKVLIIEDHPEFGYHIRRMIKSLGATDIDVVNNGDDAISKISKTVYDIILCDYNLGDGKKDGQQILEETKYGGFIKSSTAFVMITAETTMPRVMGAVECQIDGYILKPFSPKVLEDRLESLINKKNALDSIEKVASKEGYRSAIVLCDEYIKSDPKNILEFLKLKGDICITMGDCEGAKVVFEKVLAMRNIPWAMVGLGKVHFFSKNYPQAREIFQETIEENEKCAEAYDWLAKTLAVLGDPKKAERVLMAAVKVSPKSILRQQALGEISYKNGDHETAENALKAAIDIGKTSCFKSPSNYTNLAKVLVEKQSPEEALTVLKDARKESPDDPESLMQYAVTEGFIYHETNQEEKAKKSFEEATKLFNPLFAKVPLDLSIDIAKAYSLLGEEQKSAELMQDIVKDHHEDEEVVKKVRDAFEYIKLGDEGERIITSSQHEIIRLNKQGVRLVKAGKLTEAANFFEKAANRLPGSKVINLNTARIMIRSMQQYGKNDRDLYRCRQHLDRVRKIDPYDTEYQKTLSLYEEMAVS